MTCKVAGAVGEIVVRQQNLRGFESVFAKRGFIHLHQSHLADRRGGLQLVDLVRTGFPAKALHAFCDGTTGNEQDVNAAFAERCNLPDPILDQRVIHTGTVIGDECGADLDDDAFGLVRHQTQSKTKTPAWTRLADMKWLKSRAKTRR